MKKQKRYQIKGIKNITANNNPYQKAIELRDSYDDSQIEEFKIKLQKLSQSYF